MQSVFSLPASAREHVPIHFAGESEHLPPSCSGPALHRPLLHRMVLRLRGHLHKVHERTRQGNSHFPHRRHLHGTRHSLPYAVGRDLCMKTQEVIMCAWKHDDCCNILIWILF